MNTNYDFAEFNGKLRSWYMQIFHSLRLQNLSIFMQLGVPSNDS